MEETAEPELGLPLSPNEHRTWALLGLGFTPRQAADLAWIPDIVHAAEALLAEGCPHRLACRILRD